MLRLLDATLGDKPGEPDDWAIVLDAPLKVRRKTLRHDRYLQVEYGVQQWLSWGQVQLQFSWKADQRRPHLVTVGEGLFGTIAGQLAYATLAGEGARAHCYHCDRLFPPKRRPQRGRRAFCPRCQKEGIPQMLAKRDFDNRKVTESRKVI